MAEGAGEVKHKCRNYKLCGNTYTDVAGKGWGKPSVADCLPCYYAGLMRQVGQTPESVEGVPAFMEEFMPSLQKMGWTWEDVRRSYNAGVTLL